MMPHWIALFVACQPPEPGGDEAIEITGYLDASRVSWTVLDDRVQAAGSDGAASPGSDVLLTNLDSGAEVEGSASDAGAFVLLIPAADGDVLELRVADDAAEHDVVTDRAPFPTPTHASAVTDPHRDHVAVVELAYDPPLTGGHVWVSNPHHDGAVILLDAFSGGAFHGGHVEAVAGDVLLLWWVPAGGVESLPLELEVANP